MAITRAKLNKIVHGAIKATGELRTSIVYRVVTPGVYDPVTDTTTDVTSDTPLENVVLAGLTQAEYGWFPADRNTQKALIPTLELGTIVPKETDKIVIDSDEWEIVKIKSPPGSPLFVIYIELS